MAEKNKADTKKALKNKSANRINQGRRKKTAKKSTKSKKNTRKNNKKNAKTTFLVLHQDGKCNTCKNTLRDCICKNEMGRPTKMDVLTIKKLLAIFSIDGTKTEACAYAGITTNTLNNRLDDNKYFFREFSEVVGYNPVTGKAITEKFFAKTTLEQLIDEATATPFIETRKSLIRNIKKGNQRAIDTFIKTRDPRYSDKMETDHKGLQIIFGGEPSQFAKKPKDGKDGK